MSTVYLRTCTCIYTMYVHIPPVVMHNMFLHVHACTEYIVL